MLPDLCLEGRNVASGRTSAQRCSILPSSLPSSHLLKGGPSPGNTPRALPWSLQNTFSWVTEGGFFFLCFPWDLLATVSSGCLASLGTFLPPPASAGVQIHVPQRGSKEPEWHGGISTAHAVGCSWEKLQWSMVPAPGCSVKSPVPFPLAP